MGNGLNAEALTIGGIAATIGLGALAFATKGKGLKGLKKPIFNNNNLTKLQQLATNPGVKKAAIAAGIGAGTLGLTTSCTEDDYYNSLTGSHEVEMNLEKRDIPTKTEIVEVVKEVPVEKIVWVLMGPPVVFLLP